MNERTGSTLPPEADGTAPPLDEVRRILEIMRTPGLLERLQRRYTHEAQELVSLARCSGLAPLPKGGFRRCLWIDDRLYQALRRVADALDYEGTAPLAESLLAACLGLAIVINHIDVPGITTEELERWLPRVGRAS
jgi:hypothetical protein